MAIVKKANIVNKFPTESNTWFSKSWHMQKWPGICILFYFNFHCWE